MLSPGGARGVEKAELNGNVDSDYDHGGSSRTYVLHRARCSQEDDQLLRQGCERSGSPGRQGWGNLFVGREQLTEVLYSMRLGSLHSVQPRPRNRRARFPMAATRRLRRRNLASTRPSWPIRSRISPAKAEIKTQTSTGTSGPPSRHEAVQGSRL